MLIYRPSLLLGNREEFRLSEFIMIPLFKLFKWFIPRKYHATNSKTLAAMMHKDLDSSKKDTHIIEADNIR